MGKILRCLLLAIITAYMVAETVFAGEAAGLEAAVPKEQEAGIALDGEHFPDDAFLAFTCQYDLDGNGELSEGELLLVEDMDVSQRNVENLEGISYFISLKSLDCGSNRLKELDVSELPLLEEVNAEANQLVKLDMSGCTYLKSLNCERNLLKELDLSDCAQLQYLNCGYNLLEQLDLEDCEGLLKLVCYHNRLEELTLQSCVGLKDLDCRDNLLCMLDVSACGQIGVIYAEGNERRIDRGNTFDFSLLDGFEAARISGLVNAAISGKVITVSDANEPVAYLYDLGNGEQAEFTLYFPAVETEEETQKPHVHVPGDWVIEKQATLEEEGLRIRRCTECGQITAQETIPRLEKEPEAAEQENCYPHEPGELCIVREATAKERGFAEIRCLRCRKLLETRFLPQYTVKWNESSAKMQVKHSTAALKAECLSGDQIRGYRSSNKKVASVDSNGKITAKKTGTAKITAETEKGAKASITIKVQKKPVAAKKLIVNTKSLTLKKGKSCKLFITRIPVTATQAITYSSSDKKIITVNRKGKLTAKKRGKASVTAKCGKKKVKIKVRVQ